MLLEAARVLKPGARLMLVSFGNPEARAYLLAHPSLPWSSVDVHVVGRRLRPEPTLTVPQQQQQQQQQQKAAQVALTSAAANVSQVAQRTITDTKAWGVRSGWGGSGNGGDGVRVASKFEFSLSEAYPVVLVDEKDGDDDDDNNEEEGGDDIDNDNEEEYSVGRQQVLGDPRFPVNASTHYCYVCTKKG